jgi:DNA replication initiation complex subunit (GINS family)
MDPHSIPESDEELPNTVNMQTLYVAIAESFDRYMTSNRIPTEQEIRTKLEERVEAEKQKFIGELDVMSAERRKLELTLKSLGMGKWAVGGSMTIRKYDAQRYEDERVERAQAGLVDYTTLEGAGQEGQGVDQGVIEDVNDGYDHEQLQEDDY